MREYTQIRIRRGDCSNNKLNRKKGKERSGLISHVQAVPIPNRRGIYSAPNPASDVMMDTLDALDDIVPCIRYGV